MSKVTNAALYQALSILGVKGDPKEVVRVEIEHDQITVLRHQLRDGKPWLDDAGRIVLTSEDIPITLGEARITK